MEMMRMMVDSVFELLLDDGCQPAGREDASSSRGALLGWDEVPEEGHAWTSLTFGDGVLGEQH